MPKNHIKGKNDRPKSNKATGRDYSYDKKYQKSPEKKKYRASLNKAALDRGIYGQRFSKGKDLSHTKSGKIVLEDRSQNRKRNGSGNNPKKK